MHTRTTNDRSAHHIGATTQHLDWLQGSSGNKTITLDQTSAGWYGVIGIGEGEQQRDITCTSQAPGGTAHIVLLLVATPASNTTVHVHTDLIHDTTTVAVHLLTFLLDEGKADIDGSVFIAPQTKGCSGRLLEETILLGTQTRLKTIPRLDVRTSHVQASHGATVQRISPQKLFYLNAKGIAEPIAQRMIITGHLETLLQGYGVFSEREQVIAACMPHILPSL